ncbi:MAG TPA: hypothetical protein VJP40_05025, partial [bacterium]|nr:hypothetical protein [bacterium]
MNFRIGQGSADQAGGRGAEGENPFSGAAPISLLQQHLTGRLSPAQSRTLAALAGETDAELFGEGLLDLARRTERSDNLEAAALIYRWFDSEGCPNLPNVQVRARQALDAIEGRGEVGARAEFLMGRFFHEASNPSAIFAMGAAGALFRATRLASLARLTAGEAGFLSRGFGARAASSLTGFAVEATAFPFLHRAADTALGRSLPWDGHTLAGEVASSFFTLGALKFCGWGAGAAFRRTHGLAPGFVPSFAQQAFQQAGMFGGIMLGHGLETMVGLRQPQDRATSLVDALAMLLQFNVAGNLSRRAFGQNFHAWERSVDLQAEVLQRPRPTPTRNIFGQPALAMAGVSAPAEASLAADPRLANLVFSQATQESTGELPALYRNKPDYRIEYPPELESGLARMEEQMRAPDYLEGSREELLERRPDAELVDRLWFHQLKDMFRRIPFARVSELDDSVLLSRMENYGADPHPELVNAARARLGDRGLPGSSALKILEVRMSYQDLQSRTIKELYAPEGSFDQIGGLQSELQRVLGDRLQFMGESKDGVDRVVRIPSLSYAEALLQNAVGAENLQFHYVDGAISRDQVMSLRSRRVSPVGMSRGLAWLGDIPAWVHPAAFSAHDAITHGSLDSGAAYGSLELSRRFYDWLRQYDSGHEVTENLMNRLSDGEMRYSNFGDTGLAKNIRAYFDEAIPRILDSEGSEPSRRLGELNRLLERARPWWIREMAPENSDELRVEAQAWEQLHQQVRAASKPRLVYPPSIEAAWNQIEQSFARPDYYEGNWRQLARARADMDAVDKVWLHQAEHFVEVLPKVSPELRDVEAILEINPRREYPQAAALLREALELLGERGRPGSIARQVLVMHNNDRSESGVEWIWDRFMQAMPVMNMVEHFLKNRIRLETMQSSDGKTYIPSLSLLEALYSVGYGCRVQIHPVPGEVSRDTAMALRRRGVSPVGFSRQLTYLSHFEEDVHPFGFSAHDAIFHTGVLGKMGVNYPRTAGWLYDLARERLPAGQVREDFMDALADLNVPESKDLGIKMFRKMMEQSLNAAHRVQEAGSPEELEARVEMIARNIEGFRTIVQNDFNAQGALVRAKGGFLKSLQLIERRVETARRLREASDALEIGAPPIRYSGESLDLIHQIESRYATPGYYEGSREELLAKRPPLEWADQLWFTQAYDYASRIPGAEAKVLGSESLLEPLREGESLDAKMVRSVIAGLPSTHREAHQVLEISLPVEFLGPFYDRPELPELRFLATSPLTHDFENALNGRVQLSGLRDGQAIVRIPSLSLSERLVQAVHGADRAQFHFVPGVLPRDIVSSLHARRVSAVSLTGAPLYFPEYKFDGGNGTIHPWSFSQHDALEHASRDASVARGVPEAAHWLYTRIRDGFPDSGMREATLDRLTDLVPRESSEPFEGLSRILFHELEDARNRIRRLGVSEQKSLGNEARIFAESLRQLIREEFAGHPDLAANRRYFEERLAEAADILDWTNRNELGMSYLSRIHYPPEIQANWDSIVSQLGRRNGLNGDSQLGDLVDRHWHFQAEDWARSVPGSRVRILDLDVFSEPSSNRDLRPDLDFLHRAEEALGERGRPGSVARRVLELEMPGEEFEERFMGDGVGDKTGVMMGGFLSAEESLGHRILMVEPAESTIRF